MRKSLIAFLLILSSMVGAQQVGEWTIFAAFIEPSQIVDTGKQVFALASGNIYSYDKADNAIVEYNKLLGLSDTDISLIDYDDLTKSLIIIYSNQNIDLIKDGEIHNLPDLKDKVMSTDKTINSISINNGYAYLASAFGGLVIDLDNIEIKDTYNLNIESRHFFKAFDHYCISSAKGDFYVCPDSLNAYDFGNWSRKMTFGVYNSVTLGDETIVKATDNKFYRCLPSLTMSAFRHDLGAISINSYDNKFLLTSNKGLLLLDKDTREESLYTISIEGYKATATSGGSDYWVVADNGINKFVLKNNELTLMETDLIPNSMMVVNPYGLEFKHDRLYVSTGGRFRELTDQPGLLSIYDGMAWTNITRDDVKAQANLPFTEITDIAVSANDPEHFFASSFYGGVYEFKGNKAVGRYLLDNSTLGESFGGNAWASSIEVDADNNLWTVNSVSEKQIHKKVINGKDNISDWTGYPIDGLGKVGDLHYLIIAKNGYKDMKWFISYYNSRTVNVLDDSGSTPKSKSITTLIDQDGKVYENLGIEVRSIVEDLEGDIWLGTSLGPFILPAPKSIDDVTGRGYRIKVARNDGSGFADYLLDNVMITAYAVDAANRKWIGTAGSGLYLVSDDGQETLAHFTSDNSPLPNDGIISLAYDNKTGKVYIGCKGGLLTYQGDAKEGSEDFSTVTVYPNPVRPEYGGRINISGLMDNTLVKITDVNNNLIYQSRSLGGHLSWDGLDARGDRIKSGVYFVYGLSENGKEGVLTKFLVVR